LWESGSVSYTYDNMNRLLSKSYNDSSPTTPTVTYSYDQTTYNGLSISNGKGRRTGMSDGSGQTAWSFDSVGNVLSERRTINGQTKTINYTYNLDGSIATIQYPGTRTITYAEGNAQRVASVKDLGTNINYAQTATYAPPGALASVTYGYVSGGFGGITENRTYNNRLETTGIQATSSAGTALNLAYGFVTGNNGNIATQTNNVTSGRTETYTYDALNRLLTAQTAATSGGDCWGQSFGNGGPPPTMATDPLANLFYATATQCSAPQPRFTVNGNNQFTGTGISYDSAGDMTADTGYTYTYDAENRIITASGMTGGPYCYRYDGNGMRVMKAHASGGSCTGTVTVDMLYWRNIAGNTIAETDGTGSTTNASYSEYVFFAGSRVAQSNPSSGNVYYYFVDHLGSTRVVTTATGTACYEADYLPYGTENTPSGFSNTCSTRYRFTGYERDLETAYGTSAGNDYAFARYYNSRLGRFMSADPLAGDVTDPQSLNRYAYVRNNPVNRIDPSGMCSMNTSEDTGLDFCADLFSDLLSTTFCLDNAGPCFTTQQPVPPPLPASLAPPPPAKPKPNEACLKDLKTAGQNAQALDNASNNWGALGNAAGGSVVSASLLAAIGIRESGFNPNAVQAGGQGVGAFQIDLGQNPTVTRSQAFNVSSAANWAVSNITSGYNLYARLGYGPVGSLAGAIRNYNGSGGIPTSTLLNAGYLPYLDLGTTRNNYLSNVVAIARDCFDSK
jgi:RHS repeat-associated protein